VGPRLDEGLGLSTHDRVQYLSLADNPPDTDRSVITRDTKRPAKRRTRNPFALFDVAGAAYEVRASLVRFVGRDHELAVLRTALHDASAGRGRLLFLVGEPGIGKTSLAAELAGEATREGAQVLIGHADDSGGASPFWPWVQIVRGYLDKVDTDTVRTELGAGAADVAAVIPDVREWLPGMRAPALSTSSD